jgi:predicted MFS family arabinose efflux permease
VILVAVALDREVRVMAVEYAKARAADRPQRGHRATAARRTRACRRSAPTRGPWARSTGLAQSEAWLIASRALQGVGAAILAPSTLALLQTSFPEGRERTRAVAYYGAVAGVGASLGLVLGGILTTTISWRVGFFINVSIGTAMVLAAPRYLPETERHPGELDFAGTLCSTLGMTALVYGIVRSATSGWTDPPTVAVLAAGVLLLALFVVSEQRARQPIMPLRLFRSRERSCAYAARILFLGAMMGFWFFITQFLQGVSGYSPIEAGLAFLPMTVVNFAVAITVPRLTRRFGNGLLLAGGLTLTMIGMAWLSRLAFSTPYLTGIALPMVLIGAGQGATLSPLTAAGIAGVASEDAGAASGWSTLLTSSAGHSDLASSSPCSLPPAPLHSAPGTCSRTKSRRRSPSAR